MLCKSYFSRENIAFIMCTAFSHHLDKATSQKVVVLWGNYKKYGDDSSSFNDIGSSYPLICVMHVLYICWWGISPSNIIKISHEILQSADMCWRCASCIFVTWIIFRFFCYTLYAGTRKNFFDLNLTKNFDLFRFWPELASS